MDDIEKIPKPTSKEYRLREITNINYRPHPYCITTAHIAYASDNHSGMLGAYEIEKAEEAGKARCGMYVDDYGKCYNHFKSGARRCDKSYREHTSDRVLAIQVTTDKDLNEVEGLRDYLKSIADALKELRVDGVIFIAPKKEGQGGDNDKPEDVPEPDTK